MKYEQLELGKHSANHIPRAKPPKRAVHRSAFTLAEMVAVMILMTAIISMVALITRRSLQNYSRTIDRALAIRLCDRLQEKLRRDIHLARSVTISDDHATMQLELAGNEQIEYRTGVAGLERHRTLDGRKLPVETFRDSETTFERTSFPKGDLVSIRGVNKNANSAWTVQSRLGLEQLP